MTELKSGWRVVKFGEVVRQCKESVDRDNNSFERYVEGGHMDSENIHIRQWGKFGTDYVGPAFHRIFRKGQVLYGSRRTYLKKVAIAEFDGITANTTFVCETKDPNVFRQELLPFLMLTDSFTEHSIRESKGSTNPYINWPDIAKYEFPLPPLDEQKRIAEILWAADEAVERYKESLDSLTTVKSLTLRQSLRHGSTREVVCAELYSAPPRNGFSPKTNASGTGYPTLSIGSVRDGRVDPSGNTKFAEISQSDLDVFRLRSGDILVVRGNGNKHLCGKAGLVMEVPDDCFYPDLLIRIAFDSERVLPDFAVAQWNDPLTHSNLLSLAKSTNGIWKVNGKDLRQHKLLIPDIEVQRETVKQLSIISAQENELSKHIEVLHGLQRQITNGITMGASDV